MPSKVTDSTKARRERRRRPSQERSQALVKAILDATAELLATDGPSRTTTNRVADRAGVSIGSVYQYFPDKQALYEALAERYVGQLRDALDGVWARVMAAPLEQVVPSLFGALIEVSRRDPTLSGMLHLTAVPAGFPSSILAFERELEARAAELLVLHRPRLANPLADPELSARILVRAVGGIVGRTLTADPELVASPRLAVEVLRLVMGYLGPTRKT
jgi:AcrR family transcriptional regulator